MSRPTDAGLEYWQMPTDFFEQDSLHFVIAKHGIVARGVISSLMSALYNVGYCYRWTERDRVIFADKIKTSLEVVETIVSDALNEGFFDLNLYSSHSILSSKDIQSYYEFATKKRSRVKMKREFLLFTPQNPNIVVSGAETGVSGDIEERKLGLQSPTAGIKSEETPYSIREYKRREREDTGSRAPENFSSSEKNSKEVFLKLEHIQLTTEDWLFLLSGISKGDDGWLKRQCVAANARLGARKESIKGNHRAHMESWLLKAINNFHDPPTVAKTNGSHRPQQFENVVEERNGETVVVRQRVKNKDQNQAVTKMGVA